MASFRPLRRRDFLALTVLGVGGLAAVKVCGRLLVGAADPAFPPGPAPLQHLSPRQAAIATAAALAMVGPAAEAAYLAKRWQPAAGVDGLLDLLYPDQRALIGLGLNLLEEWTLGLRGFSSWDRPTQRAFLDDWRTSPLGLKRSIWGFLHAATCSSFSGTEAGWELVGYPGPCVGRRAPGQSALVDWDEAVP